MRGHLVEFLIIRDLVQVLEQPLQKIKIRGRELTEQAPNFGQTRLKVFNF